MRVAVLSVCLGVCSAWPGLGERNTDASRIGPDCTVNAHGQATGQCPNMKQPDAPGPAPTQAHEWPEQFIVDWKFYFLMDEADKPPYASGAPSSPHNVTKGTTWYQVVNSEVRNMRESYESYCIPVFGDPTAPMGVRNDYSCDFINVGATNTSYVVTHEDRPEGVPECCIIGRPFHPPPQDFHKAMPVKWTETISGQTVDWGAIYDKDAGIFNYGFTSNSTPYVFYMKGVPWIANWMWQPFENFRTVAPPAEVWNIPHSCASATACPGW